ncbi:MAG: hypothetical protein ACP5SI_01325 [Chloroflexia bacterium]
MVRRIATVVLPWLLGSVVGFLVLIHFFVAVPGLSGLLNGLVEWATIIAAFAVLVGVTHLVLYHGRRALRRECDWGYSAVLLLAMAVVLVLGFRPGSYGPGDPLVEWVFRYILEPLATTFFSLLAFSLATGIVRALRLRNVETILVTVAAVIVLLGQAPITSSWAFLRPVARLQEWLLRVPAAAGMRVILIGAAIGAVTAGMRVLLGLERPYSE